MKSIKEQYKEASALVGKEVVVNTPVITFTVEKVIIMIDTVYFGDKQSILTEEEMKKNGVCVAVVGEGFVLPYTHVTLADDEKNNLWYSTSIYHKFDKIEKIEVIKSRSREGLGVVETWGEIGNHRILIDSEKKS